jgi:hypothetical protein
MSDGPIDEGAKARAQRRRGERDDHDGDPHVRLTNKSSYLRRKACRGFMRLIRSDPDVCDI